MESDINSHRVRLVPLLQQSETLEKDCESMERVIHTLTCRNLADPEIAKLASLSNRAAVIHAALPGKSPASRDIALDSLSKNVSLLESALVGCRMYHNVRKKQAITRKCIEIAKAENNGRNNFSEKKNYVKSFLAMEAHGNFTDINTTEEDEAIRDISAEEVEKSQENHKTANIVGADSSIESNMTKTISSIDESMDRQLEINSIPFYIDEDTKNQSFLNQMVTVAYAQPSTVTLEVNDEEPKRSQYLDMGSGDEPFVKCSVFTGESGGVSHSMEQVFTNLDNIEEAIENDEEFPMENLADYEERYALMEASLKNALQKVEDSQMTLDMLQVEHTRERVNNMERDLDERKKRAVEDVKEWKMLHNVLFDAEKCIAMGDRAMDRMLGREGTPPLEELEERQTAIEELLPRAESLVCDSVRRLSLILPRLHDGGERAIAVRSRVREVEQRFRDLVRIARDERLRLDARAVDQGQLRQGLENLRFWYVILIHLFLTCDETDIEMKSDVNPLDAETISENIRITGIRIEQISEKKSALIAIEAAKERLIEQGNIDVKIKHDIRRAVSDVAKRIADLRSDLSDRHQELLKQKKDCDLFWEYADELMKKANDIQRRITVVAEAVIFTPSPDHIAACRSDALKLKEEVARVKERIQKANASYSRLSGNAEKQIIDIITACRTAIASAELLKEPQVIESLTESESQNTVIDISDAASVNTASIISSATTVKPENLGEEEVENPLYTARLESVARLSELCDEEKSFPRLDPRDEAKWQSLTQLRHWLGEQERKAGLTVDLSDPPAVRDMTAIVQGVMDHIRLKTMDVVAIQDTSVSNTVKQKARELLSGNAILDTYTRDDAHSLSHQQSKLNMRWTKFNDNVRIRRAVLEASLRSRSDFHSAFSEFEDWLTKVEENIVELKGNTANSQAIKDTAKRRDWIQQQKTISAELEAHNSVFRAVDEMGRKLVAGLDAGKEKADMQARLDRLEHRWREIERTDTVIKQRLENAELEWEKLITALSTLIDWIEDKSKEVIVLITNPQDAEQRRCGLQIYVDSEKLKEKWAELGKQISEWDRIVQQAAQRLQEMERAVAECQLHLSSVEVEMEKTRPVEQLRLEELKDARHEADLLATHVDSLRVHIDDANDACGRILAADSPLDQHPRNQLDAVNQRYLALKTTMRVRVAALRNALADFGPSSEHFLNQSVALPWQRAISKTNQLPYYIDHTTERTQWEHPVWVEMAKELSQFNRVKFIAYRTAMKLRALQKRLCLDLVDIPMLEKAFNRLTGLSNEESPGLEGMVCCLLPLFEQLHDKHPQLVRSVALAVDLCINFLLNLYDPSRDGILRVLSFKIALVVFSNSQLEEKYRYLFNLVAQETQTDQKHIALLLYDLVHIPRLVGEAAAFGGSNVEPSVRSCFEGVRLSPSISVTPFLEWLKQEPQSIVWLPVMHRLATAEFAKHQAKCNVCKMFPIVGLRYRCLRCFNLDLCQNCFFSQRTAKRHKLKHPMQEYAVPTTSSEDARDFARMVRNKFGRSKNNLGYLPVDMSDEGRPLAAPPVAANNPATDAVHQRTILMAHRLAQLTASQTAEPRDDAITELKSPAQLISQIIFYLLYIYIYIYDK
uniref:WW domain-containing protein n=1 Tax=Heterorhabditis bacteriophora TaxID=37862 RepID=A0A1I7XHA0_HETBA